MTIGQQLDVVQMGSRQMGPDGVECGRWVQMGPDGVRWGRDRWVQMGLIVADGVQMGPDGVETDGSGWG